MITLTRQRDTDRLITEHLDDKTLLNLCIAAPTLVVLQDDSFWRDRLLKKYGLINKSPGKTWKTLYLQLKYYMHNETYMDDQTNMHCRMVLAAQKGHQDLVEFFISKGATGFNDGMVLAAERGHRELVKFFVSKGANKWNEGMHHSARGCHWELVEFFINKRANNWNQGIYGASEWGHLELVKFFFEMAGEDYDYYWNSIMYSAIKGGNRDVIDFMLSKSEYDWNELITFASNKGSLELVELFIEKAGKHYIYDWGGAMYNAVSEGDIELVKFFINKGVKVSQRWADLAFVCGHYDILNYFRNEYGLLPEGD